MRDVCKPVGGRQREGVLDPLMEVPLVPLQRQHVVATLLDDALGQRGLAPHGIDGDDARAHVQGFQQHRQRRNLVGLGVHRHPASGGPVGARPGTHQMERRLPGRAVVGPPQRLAVQGDDPARGPFLQRRHPAGEAPLELCRV